MAKTITRQTVVKRDIIICSICGKESNYSGATSIKLWEGRDWFCREHRRDKGDAQRNSNTRRFWALIQHDIHHKTHIQIAADMKLSPVRVKQLIDQARRDLAKFETSLR